MRKIPKFVLIRSFEAAARLKSFSLAALELHLTPSAISHQVRELEEYFEIPLFIRRVRQVELTAEGRRLFESLARVMDALEIACAEVHLAPSAQVLAVHCSPSLAVKWLGPRLPRFTERYPDTTIRLSSGAEPIHLTQAREIDVAISYGFAHHDAGTDVMPLGTERIAPLCSPTLLKGNGSAVESITSLPLIESQLSQVTWRDWFSRNNLALPPRPRPSFDRAALAISAATDGMGVTLESTRLAEREIARGELVELGADVFESWERATHFFSQRANEQHLAKIKIFREWLFEQIGLEAG